ncbi:MAG: 5,10-methenyltetrahydrofolate synthetase [Clostridiales bacterium]|jgi:5-formyltetrahydrofolate cyclo-ligase|nr:5,10-methenyltetrahydrofolate synthetase [Clostridiales bacterium]
MLEKKQIRSYIVGIKHTLDDDTLLSNSKAVTDKILSLPQYKAAEKVFIFCSINREIDTKFIIQDALANNKIIALPKVDNNEMIFHKVKGFDELNDGFFGVREPSIFSPIVKYTENSIVIVPGVAFDNNLNRLGYGGGYYDRFFHKNPKAFKVAIAHDFQILDSIKVDDHDVKVDMLVTEKRIISTDQINTDSKI